MTSVNCDPLAPNAKMRAKDESIEKLESGESVWCGWTGRRVGLPPGGAASLLPAPPCPGASALYVSGVCALTGALVATVCPENQRTNLQLKRVNSEHLYSVTGAPVSQITLALRHDEGTPHPHAIKCAPIQSRSPTELILLRGIASPGLVSSASAPKPKIIAASRSASTPVDVDKVKPERSPVESKMPKTKSNPIAGLFARQFSSPKITQKNDTASEKAIVERSVKTEVERGVKAEVEDVKKVAEDSLKKDLKSKLSNGESKSSRTVVKTSKKNKAGKKRKRIVAESEDSDSDKDDIFEPDPSDVRHPLPLSEEDDMDEIPPTPEVVPQKRKAQPEVKNSSKRRRDKTYMGDDGFFHTIKNVLCSDDEGCDDQKENDGEQQNVSGNCDEIPSTPVREEKPNSRVDDKNPVKEKAKAAKTNKKKSPVQIKQQSNIMSFFKKK